MTDKGIFHMKKLLTAAAILGAFGASQAFAQVQSHTGFSLGANLALTSTNTEATVSGLNLNAAGQSSVGAAVQAAFSYAATDSVLLSVGATYSLADIDALSFSSSSGSGSLKLRNAYSVYVEPGYLVADKTIAFARLSYEAATMRAEASGSTALDKDIGGTGLGFGLRTLVSKNLYLQAEARRVVYNSARFAGDTTDFKTSMTVGSVGLGYKF